MCYEVDLNEPENHPQGKFIIEICEPAKLFIPSQSCQNGES